MPEAPVVDAGEIIAQADIVISRAWFNDIDCDDAMQLLDEYIVQLRTCIDEGNEDPDLSIAIRYCLYEYIFYRWLISDSYTDGSEKYRNKDVSVLRNLKDEIDFYLCIIPTNSFCHKKYAVLSFHCFIQATICEIYQNGDWADPLPALHREISSIEGYRETDPFIDLYIGRGSTQICLAVWRMDSDDRISIPSFCDEIESSRMYFETAFARFMGSDQTYYSYFIEHLESSAFVDCWAIAELMCCMALCEIEPHTHRVKSALNHILTADNLPYELRGRTVYALCAIAKWETDDDPDNESKRLCWYRMNTECQPVTHDSMFLSFPMYADEFFPPYYF